MNTSLFDQEYRLYSRRPEWELENVKLALTILPLLNTEREKARLGAVKAILAERRKAKRKVKGIR